MPAKTNKITKNMVKKITLSMSAQGVNMQVNKEEMALAVKQYRLRQGLTQRQLAAEWGISRESIIRIEGAKQITWQLAYRAFAKLSDSLRKEGLAKVEEE